MSSGLDTPTTIGGACGAKIEFFLSDKDGARDLREAYPEISQRLRSLFSVRIELSCPTHPNAQGEWIALTGSSRDDIERAKEYILTSFTPRCRVELASIDIATVSSQSSLSSHSSPMAHAVQNHYDGPPQPPPLTSSSVSSYSVSSFSSGRGGTTLYPRSSSLSPPYQSPSPTTSLEHQNYHHHSHYVPTTSTSPYHPPNIDVRSREEPTPVTSTLDNEEQLRNAILQLPPERLKNLLLDATMAGGRLKGSAGQQQFQQPSTTGSRMIQQHHSYVSSGSGGHGLLSRSPDQREKKINYFVNMLNYPREKVESVLDQLGPDAADNDILERLVKVCRPNNVQARTFPSNGSGVGYKTGGGHSKYTPTGGSGGMGSGGDSMLPPSQLSPPLPMAPSAVAPATMPVITDPARLRHIVIDGSNVAMRHGNGNFYSCRGIQLAVDYFRKRGHDKITVFVPEWRKEVSKPETPIAEQEILHLLERESVLKYTPSRRIRGKRVACYDDRFILDLATHEDGVIVSNDQFRDLMDDKPEWREVIETRLLPFQFVDDYFMIPQDPMGKDGPMLDQMLTKNYPKDLPGKQLKPSSHSQSNRQICPYLEKCTFGRKCKFYHPERDQRNDTAASTPQNSMSPIGNRTPNASRSTTPSPSPEKWSHSRYSNSNRSSGEDLRQQNSNSGSTDDLTRYQGGSGGGMNLAELVQNSLRIQDGPPQQQGAYYHQRPVPPNSMNLNPPIVGSSGIHSAPVFSTNSVESAASTPSAGVGGDSQHLSHRYTFPMAVVPQPHHIKSSRTHILTEHHHLSSTLTPTQPHEIGGDPSIMYSLQPHQHPPVGYASSISLQQDPALSHHNQQQPTIPGMFMPRDSWHYSATPHELHPPSHGGSLMQAPTTAFYAPSQQQGAQLPPDPPGYNSRAAAATSNNSNCLHPHPVGSSSVIHVPSTHTSPYHHHHQSQSVSQPQLVQDHLQQHQHQHRHHSLDYGHPHNVSPHRKRSYSNDVHKQPNGHLPQVTSSPALMAAAGTGGGPYNYDYQGSCSSTTGVGAASLGGASGRPTFLGHQSSASAVFAQSTHLPPPPPPSHYNHRLPAVNESVSGTAAVNVDVFRQLSAVIPGHEDRIHSVMAANPHVLDIGELVTLVQQ